MNTRSGLALLFLASAVVPAPAQAGDKTQQTRTPVACQLPADALAERIVTISELFERHDEVRELEDGYAFRFPGDDASAARLIDFVRFERTCCSFFVLELTFEPDQGPIWLGVRGSQAAKTFVESWLHSTEARGD